MTQKTDWLFNNKVYTINLSLTRMIFSGWMQFVCFIKGVKIGKRVSFYGITFFFKHHTASIFIGSRCQFRSKSTSNLIGINRRCIVSAHRDARIVIGEDCGFSGTVIGAFIQIIIEDGVKCGANTLITDSDWHPEDNRSAAPRKVHIKENVWLGEGVKVLKGVTIGRNSVIGAGSVVTQNIPDNVIAAGNPCKVIKLIAE